MSLAFGPARRPRSSPRRWSHGAKGDASLPKGRALPHDLAFLAGLDLPQGLLWKIAAKARKQGVAAHEALLAEEIVSPEVYYACLAHRLNLAFSIDQAPDDAIAPQGPTRSSHRVLRR